MTAALLAGIAGLAVVDALNPATIAGVALILLVWINYFSRLIMYSVAWAYTSPAALEQRTAEARRAPGAALATEHSEAGEDAWSAPAAAGAGPATVARSDVPPARTRPAGGHRADRGGHSWRGVAGAGVLALLGAAVVRGFRGGES